MRLPLELFEVGTAVGGFASGFRWCIAAGRSVHAMRVVILSESFQFYFQIIGIPEEHVVKQFAANGPDHSLDERMRQGHVGNGFDLLNLQDAQNRLPAVVSKTMGHYQN